jgi:3-hydroxyisobutyrate dehydrogenase
VSLEPLAPGDRVGFVGLGNMGAPMSGLLAAAGYDVRGYDVSAQARARVPGAVERLADAADGARAVILMLPDTLIVRAVLIDEGLLDALAPGTLLIDMSSSEPTATRALAEAVAARGASFVDAPVSGGVGGARAGTLTIMVGGAGDAVAACRPLLEIMGGRVTHVGPTAAGHALKSLNNLLSATSLLITSEAVLAGRRFGLDPQVMVETIDESTGRSWSTHYKMPRFVLPRDWTSGFTMRLLIKDLKIALELARSTGSPIGLGRAVTEFWERAAAALGEESDHTEIARWLEELSSAPNEPPHD